MSWVKLINDLLEEGFDIIPDWQTKGLLCSDCGTDKSVKYEHKEKTFCNICIVKTFPK